MSFFDGLRHRWRALFRQAERERELSDEFTFHADLAASQHRHEGMSEQEARDAARRELGNTTLAREQVRELSALRFVDEVGRDARYALRTLRGSPVFSSTSLLTLALGIGATATIFSMLFAILLAPLPVPRPGDLVLAQAVGARQTVDQFRYADFGKLREAPSAIELAAFTGVVASVRVAGVDDYVGLDVVTGTFFQILGLRPRMGRLLDASDETAGATAVVISEGFWRRVLSADPLAVGRTITIGKVTFTIIGVVPRAYHGIGFPANFQLAIPLSAVALVAPNRTAEGERLVTVIGRLRPGASSANAATVLDARFRACCAAQPGAAGEDVRLTLQSIPQGIRSRKEDVRAEYRRLLYILLGGVVSLLLITCVNVANLLLSRSALRRREFAVRLSLGASRARVIRQCLTESVVLGVLGGALGLGVAFAAGRLLVAGLSTETAAVLGDLVTFRANGPVLALMAGISLAAGIAFGLAPAWRATAPDLERSLREGGRRSGGSRAGGWLRRAFVVSQFVLTLLLAVLAGLFGRSLRNLRHDDLGFARTNALIAFIDPRATPYQDRPLVPLYEAILARASGFPGVQAVSVSSYAPILGGAMLRNSIAVPGREAPPGESPPQFDYVSSGFFSTVGLRFVSGRSFTENEGRGVTRVAVVNQAFARRYFGPAGAVSRQFRFPEAVTIVGVVADSRFNGPGSTVEPMVFVPYAQWPGDWTYLVVTAQTVGDPEAIARPMKRVLDELAPGIRVRSLTTIEEQLDRSLERQRLAAGVAAVFGLLGLCLAAVGLYGVVAYLVTARTGEFGIRLALGAHPRMLFWLVLREALTLAGLGIAIGLPLAVAGGRLVSAQFFGVGAADPWITGGAILTLSIVAIAASMLPARRASRVDPIQALRSE